MKTTTESYLDIKQAPWPIVILDKELTILEFSEGANHLFDHSKLEQAARLDELFDVLPKNLKKQITSGAPYKATIPTVCQKGSQRRIKTTFYPIQNTDHIHVLFEDVTRQKTQYELAIQATDIAKIGSWKVDLIKNTLFWSSMTRKIHEVADDFEPDLELGLNFYKEGKHRENIIQAVSECIESGKSYDLELIIITANGQEKWVRTIGEAERRNGKTVAFQGVFQDIDDIKREKLENEKLNNRIRVAVESANIGIWDWNVADNNLIWDENMFTLFGLDSTKFSEAYEAWETSLHPQDKEFAANEVKLALEGVKDFDTEFRIIKGDGSIASIQGRAQVFRDKKGEPLRMVGTNVDITGIKRKDERLRRLLEVTEKQNKKLVNFAHIISHNLRSNSSNISMLSGMLLSDKGGEKTQQFLEMIQTSSEKLEETLNELNEVVKIQSTAHSELSKIKVVPIIETVCEGIGAILHDAEAQLDVQLGEDLTVNAYRPYLVSVLQNLITNSVKYRHPDRQLEIRIEAEEESNQTVIKFNDNGLGIDLKKHGNKLFGMYKTFHGNKDAKGIGLFMTKNQMEAMNGKIEVISEQDNGATFLLYFKT